MSGEELYRKLMAARLECDAHKARIKVLREDLLEVHRVLRSAMEGPPNDPTYDPVHETYNAACRIVNGQMEASDE